MKQGIIISFYTQHGFHDQLHQNQELKNPLELEKSCQVTQDSEVAVLEGSAILLTVHWPFPGRIIDLVSAAENTCRS